MHRCLEIPEIVRMICCYLRESNLLRSLANFAQSCSDVHDPATDELWSKLDTLMPILHATSLSLAELRDPALQTKEVKGKFNRPLTLDDISRFMDYASRVREITVMATSHTCKMLELFRIASARDEGESFFPVLKKCTVDGPVACDNLSPLRSLMGPSLTALNIDCSWAVRPNTVSWLAEVKQQCPNLANMHYPYWATKDLQPGSMSLILRSWKSLKTVTFGPLPYDALVALSHLPHLAKLDVRIDASSPVVPKLPITGGFPLLKHLSMSTEEEFPSCYPLLRLLDKSPLETLSIARWKGSTSTPLDVIHSMLNNIAKTVPRNTLQILDIYEADSVRANIELPPTAILDDPYSLHVLHCFSNLHELALGFRSNLSTGKSTLQALSKHMPNLQALAVGDFPRYASITTPTLKLEDLIDVCRGFPSLQSLSIPLDASNVQYEWSGCCDYQHDALETLRVGGSPITADAVLPTADFLADVFPNLKAIVPSRGLLFGHGIQTGKTEHDLWMSVLSSRIRTVEQGSTRGQEEVLEQASQ